MALSYVDFIAKNVEVCVKYYENKEARWYTGKVVKVLDRYLDEDLNECVKCVVKYDDDKYTDIFCEREYNTDDENAWRFGTRFVSLVESVKAIVDDFDETEEEENDTDTVSIVESVEAVVNDFESDIDTPETTTSSSASDCDTETESEPESESETESADVLTNHKRCFDQYMGNRPNLPHILVA
jgi:hypothetical protein